MGSYFDNRIEEAEISFKDIAHKFFEFVREVKRYWYVIALLVLILGSYFVITAVKSQVEYTAKLTFMVNEDESGTPSALGGILGQFGLPSSTSRYNLDRILKLSKSRRILQEALLEKKEISGKEDFLGNHLAKIQRVREKMIRENPALKGIQFTHTNASQFEQNENILLKRLVALLNGPAKKPHKGILKTRFDDESNIMTMELTTYDSQLSISLLKEIFNHLGDFYVEKTTERQGQTYSVLSRRQDSIKQALTIAEYELAQFQEQNRNTWSKTNAVEQQRLRREVQVLNVMFGEAVKNVELSRLTLENSTPFIQPIDLPIPPLKGESPSILKGILLAIVIGIFVGSVLISLRKIYLDAMRNPEKTKDKVNHKS